MDAVKHPYEVRPRKDNRGVDLISHAVPFGRLWYGDANAVANAIGYAMHSSRSHNAVITTAKCVNFAIDLRFALSRIHLTSMSADYWALRAVSLEPAVILSHR